MMQHAQAVNLRKLSVSSVSITAHLQPGHQNNPTTLDHFWWPAYGWAVIDTELRVVGLFARSMLQCRYGKRCADGTGMS